MNLKTVFKAIMFCMIAMPLIALAETAGVPVVTAPTDPLPAQDFLALLFNSVGQIKGASGLAIAVLVTQLVMAFFRTPLANFAGKYKLLIVLSLSLVSCFVGAMAGGASWSAALMSGATIGAFQVLIHQLYVQFIKKGDETSSPTTTK